MDKTDRKITKIAREAARFANLFSKELHLGSSEYECVRYVRKHLGCSQEQVRAHINIDKAAVARTVAALVKKGYITREKSKTDHRLNCLYATEKAAQLKEGAIHTEAVFYEWLLEDLSEEEEAAFLNVLAKLYMKSKAERQAGFCHLMERGDPRA